MAKLTLTDVASLTNEGSALAAINSNFAQIEAALENTMSRDGTTPNQMAAPIDMDGRSLLNVGRVEASQYFLDGRLITDAVFAGNASGIQYDPAGVGAVARTVSDKLRESVSPEDFGAAGDGVTDDASAIQLALNAAAGGVVKLKAGKTYGIGASLLIDTDTTLDARGATIKRIAAINNMIRNNGDGATGGYAQNGNITIIGGTWDANGTAIAGNCTAIGFAHCFNIKVLNAIVLDVNAWHHVEVNGCASVEIAGCRFVGGAEQELDSNEAVQIDLNLGTGQWPWPGPADSTPCRDVWVHNNEFVNCGTGVGTHSGTNGVFHAGILVSENWFLNCYYAGVHARGWTGVKVVNNRFEGGYYGVFCEMADTNVVEDYDISHNTFKGIGSTARTGTSARAVYANGNSTGTQYVKNYRIAFNTVLDHTTAGKSTHGLTTDYCRQGTFVGNTLDGVNRAGIWAFGCDRVSISANVVNNSNLDATPGMAGIMAGATGLVNTTRINIGGNTSDTMVASQCDRAIVRNNIVTTAGGLTAANNTNTTVSENLVNTTFA